VLWFIELDQFSTPANADTLFRIFNVANPVVARTMLQIIDLWQSATGERLKDMAVRVSQATAARTPAQPTRLPAGPVPVQPPAAVASNGARRTVRT
jgi:hypothetical protein